MNKNTIIAISLALLCIVAGMFLFAGLKKSEPVENPAATTATTTQTNSYGITRIDGKHYFIDGVHTVVGEIALPTPCDLLEATSTVSTGTPNQINIAFTVINNSESCATMVTPARFSVNATAEQYANITATFMGQPVVLNLIEAAPGETPAEFQVYTKG